MMGRKKKNNINKEILVDLTPNSLSLIMRNIGMWKSIQGNDV